MSLPELATNISKNTPLARFGKIESFGLVDGPGVRSILFLSGCPFRCLYCHNPEMQDASYGELISPLEAFNRLKRFAPYWGKNGGITVSGGEPLIHLPFLIELGKLAKNEDISYVIDTSAAPFSLSSTYLKEFDKLLEVSDLFLLDLKALDPSLHKKITGFDNKNVLECFSYLAKKNFPIWVRYVLLPTYTDGEKTLKESAKFLKQFPNIQRVEVLPYHTLAIPEYEKLHRDYPIKDILPPTKEEIQKAESLLEVSSFQTYLKD